MARQMSLSKYLPAWLPVSAQSPSSHTVTAAATAAAVSSVLALWYWRQRQTDDSMPHLPTVPILGSIPFMPADKTAEFFMEKGKALGDIFDFYIGPSRTVMLNSFEAIQEAFVQHSNDFADRPDYYILQYLNPSKKGIVDIPFNKTLKENRHVSLQILKDFGFGKFQMMETRIMREVDELLDIVTSKNGEAFDPWHLMTLSVSNVINSIAFDSRYSYDDQEFQNILQRMDRTVHIVTDIMPLNFFPALRFLPKYRHALQEICKEMIYIEHFVYKQMNRHFEEKTFESGQNDFTDSYITQAQTHTKLDDMDKENLLYILRDFFMAGTETTTTTLKWGLIYMANNQDIQQRCYEELVAAFGKSHPSYEERVKVPYCRAMLHELQRISCIVPLALPHMTTVDTKVQGKPIPKDTVIFANLWNVCQNEKDWPEPNKFDPNRFIDKEGNFVKSRKVIPFSLGRRNCLGEILAKQELFLFLTSIIKDFHLTPPEGTDKLSEEGTIGFSNQPPPFTICARSRK